MAHVVEVLERLSRRAGSSAVPVGGVEGLVFAGFEPAKRLVMPVHVLLFAVMSALESFRLSVVLSTAELVLFLLLVFHNAGDPRQKSGEALGLLFEPCGDDAGVFGVLNIFQGLALGGMTGEKVGTLLVEVLAALCLSGFDCGPALVICICVWQGFEPLTLYRILKAFGFRVT